MHVREGQIRHPAIGPGGWLPRKTLLWRGGIVLGLLLAMVVARPFIAPKETWANSLSALPKAGQVYTGVYQGGLPSDYDLESLATYFHVDGIVNLGSPSVEEKVTAAALHQDYLYLPVPDGQPLSWPQLRVLTQFVSQHAKGENAVYLHDDDGGGRVVSAADMLLLLHGMSTSGDRAGLSRAQAAAVTELAADLRAHRVPW